MWVSFLLLAVSLLLLIWSADKFVEGAAGTARHFGLPPLLIGMLIVGFGTSAPEMLVSGMSAWNNQVGLALGNAFGSNIVNIALILGITALISPIAVKSGIVHKELPVLLVVTLLVAGLAYDGYYSSGDAALMLLIFAALVGWSVWEALSQKSDSLASEVESELPAATTPLSKSILWLVVGLALLILSSRLLVDEAVNIAQWFGVEEYIIGLTIVAIGTSLPELASSVVAARKNEHEIALGNIIGSNLFNSLAVVGLAIAIAPSEVAETLLTRDLPVMIGLTLLLFLMAFGFGRQASIGRAKGALLLAIYVGYTVWLATTAAPTGAVPLT